MESSKSAIADIEVDVSELEVKGGDCKTLLP